MAKRRLSITVEDDGQAVTLNIQRYELVGDSWIGPISVATSGRLSFPEDDIDQWQRDMVVQVLESL
jgi:hypothetical protein